MNEQLATEQTEPAKYQQQDWFCRSCGAVFSVTSEREPEQCVACGSFDVEPDLLGA